MNHDIRPEYGDYVDNPRDGLKRKFTPISCYYGPIDIKPLNNGMVRADTEKHSCKFGLQFRPKVPLSGLACRLHCFRL